MLRQLSLAALALSVIACKKNRDPRIEQAAEFCGVPYAVMKDEYFTSGVPNKGIATRVTVLGRCEITQDGVTGRVATRILNRPAH